MENYKARALMFGAIAVMTVLVLQVFWQTPPRHSMTVLSGVVLLLVIIGLAALFVKHLFLKRSWGRAYRGAILNQPLSTRTQSVLFAIFMACFCAFWIIMYRRVVPPKFTYDLAFSPVVIVGYSYFVILCVQSRFDGRMLGRLVVSFIAMLLLANFVDIMLMKLGTWLFSRETHWLAFDLPHPFRYDVHGNPIKMPVMEAFGFNGCITWFVLYCLSLLERFVDPHGAKAAERWRPHTTR